MLEKVLRHIHNRFERDVVRGTFTIADSSFELPGVQYGQYYWIEGSVFNDGLHQHPDADLLDEQFDGAVWLLAIPRAVVELADRISDWTVKNQTQLDSPYQSESFGGYSYTKASDASSSGVNLEGWMLKFRSELNPYRKLCDDWRKN